MYIIQISHYSQKRQSRQINEKYNLSNLFIIRWYKKKLIIIIYEFNDFNNKKSNIESLLKFLTKISEKESNIKSTEIEIIELSELLR